MAIHLKIIKSNEENTEELSQTSPIDRHSSSSNVVNSDDDGLDILYCRQTTASHVSTASYDLDWRFLADFTWNDARVRIIRQVVRAAEQDL